MSPAHGLAGKTNHGPGLRRSARPTPYGGARAPGLSARADFLALDDLNGDGVLDAATLFDALASLTIHDGLR